MSRFRKTLARKFLRKGVAEIAERPVHRWVRRAEIILPSGRRIRPRRWR